MAFPPITAPNTAGARGTLSTVAGGAWTPAALPGLVCWYDATVAASITSSSGNVSQWNTLGGSASGAHLTQATGASQPNTGGTINSKNAITFNGTSDWMAVTFTTVAQPLTVLMVSRNDNASSGCWADSNDSANRTTTYVSGTNQILLYAGTATGVAATFAATIPFQFVAVFNGASSMVYKNGTVGATVNPGAQGMHGLTVGADPSRAALLSGVVGEFAVASGVISSGDRTSWNTYCTTKWAT